MFKKVAILGIGLLGGSLGLAIRKRGLAGEVVGLVRREEARTEALDLHIADHVTLDIEDALRGADFIILATPLSTMRPLLSQAIPYIEKEAIVTDVGSVKYSLVKDSEKLLGNSGNFIGSHPMAGSDRSGMKYADGDLFVDTVCIVTPTSKSNPSALDQVTRFWKSLQTTVSVLEPRVHDELLAYASHMPHVVSACIVNALENAEVSITDSLKVSGKGWKDTTRIAASSPRIWSDILKENKKEVLRALKACGEELEKAMTAIDEEDKEAVRDIFDRSNRIKSLEN